MAKYLHVINVRWYNATAWYAVNLARVQHDYGEDVIVAGIINSPPTKKAQEYGLKFFEDNLNSSNPIKLFKAAVRFFKLVAEFKPDYIVCHRSEFFWLVSVINKLTSPRWKLVVVRGDVRVPRKTFFSRLLYENISFAVTSANFIKSYMTNYFNVPASKIAVIFGGVNLNIFHKITDNERESVRQSLGYNNDDIVVGLVGRVDKIKGYANLIDAVAILHQQGYKNYRILFVSFAGDDEEKAWINGLIERSGIKESIQVTGWRKDVNHLMNACDVGVVASVSSEAICRVAMEFMACGVPVVAADTGVLPEALPPMNIYEKHDSKALAEKIKVHSKEVTVYSDKDFYKQFKNHTS